jgi:hypothetical protein
MLPLWSLPNALVPKQRVKPGSMLLHEHMLNVWVSFLWQRRWLFCWKFIWRNCHEQRDMRYFTRRKGWLRTSPASIQASVSEKV